MNAPLRSKNRPHTARITCYNSDAAQIPRGAPVFLNYTAAGEEKYVALPSTGSAAKNTFLCQGLATANVPVGEWGEFLVAGFHFAAKVIRQSRAASTDSYASVAAIAVGDYFTIDSVNNGLARSGAGAASIGPAMFAALETSVSLASTVSTTSDTSVAVTIGLKMLVRVFA